MRRILIAEDEESIREFVVLNMKRNGYDVTDVSTGDEALRVFDENNGSFDIVLLDVMMPGSDGITICKELRQRSELVGIIMLSAKSQEMDKVRALMYGADDYLTKPFGPGELIARVDALHRRVTMVAPVVERSETGLHAGPFVLDLAGRTLKKNGQNIDLTLIEFQIMELFMRNIDVALERSAILTSVWGENYYGDEKTIDVNIRRLRMKIEDDPSAPKHLLAVRGCGYRLNVWIYGYGGVAIIIIKDKEPEL